MTSRDGTSPGSPMQADGDVPLALPRLRDPDGQGARSNRPFSEINLPFRRSNARLSAIFASTASLNSAKRASSPIVGAPVFGQGSESAFSSAQAPKDGADGSNPYRDTIIRSFVPHIAVLPSQDTEDLLAHKGFTGGFLQLIRPYGENIPGKVTIRDSNGSSRSWEDYGVRFVRLKDGLDPPRAPEQKSTDARTQQNINGYLDQYFPGTSARLRTGGDLAYVEDVVAKHLAFYETQFSPEEEDYFIQELAGDKETTFASAFHLLYLRRLLSGLPLTPHETFSHPVACAIVISSRNPDPIEALRQLYADSSTGEQRLPQWVNNDYLRYYVLVHDEENDDVQRSMTLFEQMKRHFGIHCHLLRIRSTQSVPSDDECVELPTCEWLSAAEELAEIERRERDDDVESLGPFLFESDEGAIKSFVRELVTQSVIPIMERLCATWNDQVASRRRGLGGRFLSLSKKWSFGGSRNSSPSNTSGSNYDSVQGFYRPDAPEAILRKLADYAFMLRDFKLAQSTYELLRPDYSTDKAWKYYAGVNEMTVITSLITATTTNPTAPHQPSLLLPAKPSSKTTDTLDQMLDTATYSYMTRCSAPYYALRTLAVCVELLASRGPGASAEDDTARWAARIAELDLVGLVGHALFAERVAACFAARTGAGSKRWGARKRKAALWNLIATQDWIRLERNKQAERCLTEVFRVHRVGSSGGGGGGGGAGPQQNLAFSSMRGLLEDLRDAVMERKGTIEAFAGVDESPGLSFEPDEDALVGQQQQQQAVPDGDKPQDKDKGADALVAPAAEKLDIKKHRHSLIGMSTAPDLGEVGRRSGEQ